MGIILFYGNLFSQNVITFSESNQVNPDLSKSFKSYKILKINENLSSLTDGDVLTVNYLENYTFELSENRMFAEDYSILVKSENGIESKNIYELGFDGKYFRNVNNSLNNQMAFSVFENQYTFYIKSLGKEFYIEALTKFDKEAPADHYLYYEVKDIISTESDMKCGVDSQNQPKLEFDRFQPQRLTDPCKTIELNMCVDYSFFITYPSINGVINRNLEILNLSQLNFSIENGLAYDVNFKIRRHYIITCNNCNYWPPTGQINTNHLAFAQQANYYPMFDYASDMRIFWQSTANGGGSSGTLGLGFVPSDYNCSTTPLVTVRQVTIKNVISELGTNLTRWVLSHEIGHNLGCDHVNDYNNIMSGSGYSGNAWSNISTGVINNSLANSNCYYNCQTESCFNKLVDDLAVVIENVNNTINLSWLSETDMEYKVRLYNYSTNTWSNYTTLLYPSNSTIYNYNTDAQACSYKYKIEITPICSGVSGVTQILVINMPEIASPNLSFESIAQDEILCSGLEYTFNVSASNPGDNPLYQWKINTINVGTNSPIFTTSVLQNNDVLSCEILSDEPCLTSQTSAVSKVVTVIPQPCNLSNNQFEVEEFVYFPNPVQNYFTVQSVRNIKKISIYNILGQTLLDNTIQKSEVTLDLSPYPSSTYFVKIEGENTTKTVKIIKE